MYQNCARKTRYKDSDSDRKDYKFLVIFSSGENLFPCLAKSLGITSKLDKEYFRWESFWSSVKTGETENDFWVQSILSAVSRVIC